MLYILMNINIVIKPNIDSAVNNKLFDTFLNHNFTVNWNQGGGACNNAHQFLTYMKSRCMTYFVLLVLYRCSVKVVET